MKESDNFFQKAFYAGIGVAGFAIEKANDNLQELKKQVESIANYPDFPLKLQEVADEMVERGKMNAEQARNFVDEMMKQATNSSTTENNALFKNNDSDSKDNNSPRTIEIILDDDDDE